MFSLKNFNSLLDLLVAFPTEQACIDHLTELRWGGKVVSPFDQTSTVYKCANNRYKCKNTNKYFNVCTGTVFEGKKITLQQWFLATYLFIALKGISSYKLAAELQVSQKTGWFVLQRLRFSIKHGIFNGSMEGVVEADETFVGGKNKNRHKDKKVKNAQGRSFKDKTPVLGLLEREISTFIERPNKVYPNKIVKEKQIQKPAVIECYVTTDTQAETIQPILKQVVKPGTTLLTDEWKAYTGLTPYYDHQFVNHGKGQYVNDDGATTNGIENFWSQFKRGIIGEYYKASRKHLQGYADEYSFRYNNRANTTNDKFNILLRQTGGKRITYQQLTK